MNDPDFSRTETAAIHALLERWLAGARAGDLDAIMACYRDDLVAYDAVLQLQFRGAPAYRAHWRNCMELCTGDSIFEMAELAIHVGGGDVAFAHYLLRCGGRDDKGVEQTAWMRGTVGLRRTDGAWRIAHEHISAPFDMQSNKALFDLTP